MKHNNKNRVITLRITDEEYQMLEDNSRVNNITKSEYLRSHISKIKVSPVVKQRADNQLQLIGAINRIGNNINQIAKNLNQFKNIKAVDILKTLIKIEYNLSLILEYKNDK